MNQEPTAPASAQGQAGPGVVVVASYDLFDAEGEFVESSDSAQPLQFLFGYAQVAPGLERAVEGLGPGEARRVRLPPEEAFGHRDPAAIIEIDRADFPDDIAIGDELSAEDSAGGVVVLKVVDMNDEVVVVDTNHPLAGQAVELDLVIESLRPASSEELAEAVRELESSDSMGPQTLLSAERLLKRSRERPPSAQRALSPNRVA